MAREKKSLVKRTYGNLKAEAAYKAVLPELESVDLRAIEPGRLHYAEAARAVLAAMKLVAQPSIRARFDSLPAGEFAHEELDRASVLAEALLYVRQKYESAAVRSKATVPAELVDEAMQLKSRMLEVLDYNVGDLDGVAAELASIRSGAGYTDLAQDLSRLSRLYDEHRATLAKDKVKYRAADAKTASELARTILESVKTHATAEWVDKSQRVWTLLRASYDEVRRAAMFLFAREPERLALFPSLFAAARSERGSSKAAGETTPQAPDSGGTANSSGPA